MSGSRKIITKVLGVKPLIEVVENVAQELHGSGKEQKLETDVLRLRVDSGGRLGMAFMMRFDDSGKDVDLVYDT